MLFHLSRKQVWSYTCFLYLRCFSKTLCYRTYFHVDSDFLSQHQTQPHLNVCSWLPHFIKTVIKHTHVVGILSHCYKLGPPIAAVLIGCCRLYVITQMCMFWKLKQWNKIQFIKWDFRLMSDQWVRYTGIEATVYRDFNVFKSMTG